MAISGAARALERHVDDVGDAARPRGHDDHAVGEQDRLGDVVGDEHRGGLGLLVDLQQLDVQPLAGDLVDRRERLVEQQDVDADHEQPGERDALLHAAREVARVGVLEAAEPDHVEQAVGLVLVGLRSGLPWMRRGRRVFCSAVCHCSSVGFWNMSATSWRGPVDLARR